MTETTTRPPATDKNLKFFIDRTHPDALGLLPSFGRREFEEIHSYLVALSEQGAGHAREVETLKEEIRQRDYRLAEQEARHKRVRSLLESLKKHCEYTAPGAAGYSTTYQLASSALAALDGEAKP